MSGHSKWKNIMHKKGKSDAERAKVFTKAGREIAVAIKEGGSADPVANSRLKDAIAKAKANNVPNDNIDRMIKKYAGEDGGVDYETIVYEGYGPSGVALIVSTMTDNRNRTAGDVRHYFDKFGGNLGQTNSVSWMFAKKGILVIEKAGVDEDELMMQALDAGADDFESEEEIYKISTAPEALSAVRDALDEAGYTFVSAQVEMEPSTYVKLTAEGDIKNMQKLLDALEENDDVQDVWHNWDDEEFVY